MRIAGRILALLFSVGTFVRFSAAMIVLVMTYDRPNAVSYNIGRAAAPLLLFMVSVWAFRALGNKNATAGN